MSQYHHDHETDKITAEPTAAGVADDAAGRPRTALERAQARFRKQQELAQKEHERLARGGSDANGQELWRQLMRNVGRV